MSNYNLDDFSERTPEDLAASEAAMKKDVVDWYEKSGTCVPQEGEQAPLTGKEVEELKASI